MRRPVAGLGIVALLLAGCSHPSSTTYDSGDVGRTIETSEGSVVSSREVEITGQTNAVGPVAGGAAAAATSGLIFTGSGSGLIAVLGGLIGAGAGYLIQQTANNREGFEYVLKMDDGRTVTLVQNKEDDEEQPLEDGTPVLVQVSGQYTRVIADPRAESLGGGWVDPDVIEPSGGPSGGSDDTFAPLASPPASAPPSTTEDLFGQSEQQ